MDGRGLHNEPTQATFYIPVHAPPTPSPSPHLPQPLILSPDSHSTLHHILGLIPHLLPEDLLLLNDVITPLLKRDFITSLPAELALYIMTWIDEPLTIVNASRVCTRWRTICSDETIWKDLASQWTFDERRRRVVTSKCPSSSPPSPYPVLDKGQGTEPLQELEPFARLGIEMDPALEWIERSKSPPSSPNRDAPLPNVLVSWKEHFRYHYLLGRNWEKGGNLLRVHIVLSAKTDSLVPFSPHPGTETSQSLLLSESEGLPSAVVTSCALEEEWLVVGMSNAKVQIYSPKTGVLARTLVGHTDGVWGVGLIRRGGVWNDPILPRSGPIRRDDFSPDGTSTSSSSRRNQDISSLECTLTPTWLAAVGLSTDGSGECTTTTNSAFSGSEERRMASDPSFVSEGWGQPNSLVISGGCDKVIKVWDVQSGHCIYTLRSHTSTIRCLRSFHHSPIVVSGSRDTTLNIWDIQRGKLIRTLAGHESSVRCLDLGTIVKEGKNKGKRVVASGSYDTTCRVWDIDTGSCMHVLRGHFHQVYCVVFDGERVVSGSLDSTIRVWDVENGQCLALLQGHKSLITNLQILLPSFSSTLSHHEEPILISSSSTGHLITYSLHTFLPIAPSTSDPTSRIQAHDGSITAFQAGRRYLVTGGHDGRVRVWRLEKAGRMGWLRDLICDSFDFEHSIDDDDFPIIGGGGSTGKKMIGGSGKRCNVWKVISDEKRGVVAIMGVSFSGRTTVEMWDMKPGC